MKQNWIKAAGLFFSSQAVSLFGSSLVQYAIIWYITLETESGIMTTLATLFGFLPQVLISLFAGVWADRYSKKMLIMIADGAIALSTLVIAILFMLGLDSIWLLLIALGIRSLGSGIQTPTVTSFLPEIVPEERLMRVNGINTTIQSVMLILSPAASGALLANVKLAYIFFIDVFTAVVGIALLWCVKTDKKERPEGRPEYFSAIKEGILYAKNHRLVSRMFLYLLLANILVAPLSILTPLFVTRTFGGGPFYLTLNEVVFFIGNIIGGALISIWGGFKNKVHTVCLGCVICGVLSVLMGASFSFVFYLVCTGLSGVTMPMFNTPFITLFQENVDAEKQGRVFSLISVISGCVMPLAMVFYGPLADLIKIEYILIATGILFVACTFVLLKDKVLKNAVKPAGITASSQTEG